MMLRCVILMVLTCLGGCATNGTARLHEVTAPCAVRDCTLAAMVRGITDADYHGEVANLRALEARLVSLTKREGANLDARYWLGFARWRAALNWSNEGGTFADVDPLLLAALSDFEALVQQDAQNIEAHVGIAGVAGARLFLSKGNPDVVRSALQRSGASYAALREPAKKQLRAAWVVGLAMYGAPSDPPARKHAAIDLLRSALANAPSESGTALSPTWGRPEVMSSLAWMLFDQQGKNTESSSLVKSALQLRPDWHYLQVFLAPSITLGD
jgi:hypothetical protein